MSTTVPYRTASYSGILSEACSLIGVDSGDLQTTEQTMLANFFNKGLRKAWESQSWTDLCAYGEVRFPANLITYPHDYTQTAYWTDTNLTVTSAALANPLDYRVTASSLVETMVNGVHSWSQPVAMLPNQSYTWSGYVRPNGRNYCQLSVTDGVYTYSCFFNMVQPNPITGTPTVTTGGTTPGAAIQLSGNGFYLVSLNFTTASTMTAGAGTATVNLSPDGATTSYLGVTTDGCYAWGFTCALQQNIVPDSYFISYTQSGETAIEAIFDINLQDPNGGFYPSRANYQLTPNGAVIIGPSSIAPVFVSYRAQRPSLTSASYSSSVNYVVGQTFQYTSVAQLTSGTTQVYTVTTATTAGQTPDANPTLFQQTYIPYIFSSWMVWYAYACWLLAEGQAAKAQSALQTAQTFLDDENDKQERQNGNLMPWRVNTHLTSQDRGMGYQNLNSNTSLLGTAYYS